MTATSASSEQTAARLQIMLAALLFSTGGAAIKLATFDGWQVASFRCAVAAAAMLTFLPQARRGWTWRTWVVAAPYAATFILFTLANKETTAANAIFLQGTAPLYLLLLGPLLLREYIVRQDVVFLIALVVGAALIFFAAGEPLETAPRPALGNALGLASGVTWALTIVGLRWIAVRSAQSGEQPAAAVVAGCTLACLVAVVPALPVDPVDSTAANWGIVLYLGVFQIALAYAFVTQGIRRISALESSLLLLIEPVFAPLWAWLVLAEVPPRLALAGGAVIISATALNTLWRRCRR